MKKLISSFALLFMLTVVLTGCGGGGGGVAAADPAPEWIATYPTATAIDTNMYIKARLNEAGTVYCVAVLDGATAPTPAQVKAGQNGSGTPTTLKANGAADNSGVSTLKITGLTYSIDYNAYCVAENTTPTLQAAVTEMDVTAGEPDTIFVSKIGLDTNPGSIEEPKLTIAGAMSAVTGSITRVYVSKGTYIENPVMNNGVSLYGGFSATDWSDRDVADRTNTTYRTVIQGISTSGGGAGVSFTGTSTNSWIIEGFVIASNHTGNSHGVSVSCDGTATIRYNTIAGGPGNNESNGIMVSGTDSKTVIANNTINGGTSTGASSNGIYIETAANQTITDNTINGGTGYSNSYGIQVRYHLANTSLIARNNIDGGLGASGVSYGISLSNVNVAPSSLNVVIHSNYIHVENVIYVYGISGYGNASNMSVQPGIFNNVIEAVATGGSGSGSRSWGMYFENCAGTPLVYNNTIIIYSVDDQSYGIQSQATDAGRATTADVRNNIIMGESPVSHDFGFYELANGLSANIKNNDIYNCVVVINSGSTSYYTIAELNGLRPTATSGNIDDGPVLSASPNRNLTALSPTAVTQGGLDLSGVFTIDKAGSTRTAPWSIGAYERN